MDMEMLFGILFLLMILQVVGTHLQVKQYRRAVSRLHKLGNIGIGSSRKKLGPGSIVIIACKSDGTITGGEIMQGLTIFSGFKEIKGIIGRSIYDLKMDYQNLPKKRRKFYKGHLQAIEALEMRLQPKETEAEAAVL